MDSRLGSELLRRRRRRSMESHPAKVSIPIQGLILTIIDVDDVKESISELLTGPMIVACQWN